MGVEDILIAMQLHEKLDRMENEDEQEQRLLPERVDSERAALKSTMSYSRAVAVVSMEREVDLYRARKLAGAQLTAARASSLRIPPEEIKVNDVMRDRVSGEVKKLTAEVMYLRQQILEMENKCAEKESTDEGADSHHKSSSESAPTGDASRMQNPGADTDEHSQHPPEIPSDASGQERRECTDDCHESDGSKDGDKGTPSRSRPPVLRGERSQDVRNDDRTNSSTSDKFVDNTEIRQLVEAETARVLAELRANPPPSTLALMHACREADAFSANAKARWHTVGLLPPGGTINVSVAAGNPVEQAFQASSSST